MSQNRLLDGKHAVITGGGRGIGAAIARSLAGQGAAITLMGRTLPQLEQQAASLRELTAVHCESVDVARAESVDAAFAAASARLGRIDILVNNAGQALSAPFVKTEPSLWQQMLDVNLTGVFLGTRAVLPAMLAAGWGRVINITSTAGQNISGARLIYAKTAGSEPRGSRVAETRLTMKMALRPTSGKDKVFKSQAMRSEVQACISKVGG